MCLMATSRFLSVAEIGELVEGYAPGSTADEQEAFRRMFERDKQYLRDIGIPLETGSDSFWSDEVGYRIRRSDYALPEISLDPDEAAALGLAAQLWSSTALADASASALRKLAAGGIRTLPGPDGLEPRVATTEPAFAPCLAAVQVGQAVRFPYRKPEETEPRERHVEPWGVVSWRGRWYLAGHDCDRQAARVFRLSRVTGAVRAVGPPGAVRIPDGVDLRALVSASAPPDHTRTAVLRVRPGTGHALRRHARVLSSPRRFAQGETDSQPDSTPGAPERRPGSVWGTADHRSDSVPGAAESPSGSAAVGMDLVEIDYSDTEQLARWVAGYGDDVLVEQPPQLRNEVLRRLADAARVHADAGPVRMVAKSRGQSGGQAVLRIEDPVAPPAGASIRAVLRGADPAVSQPENPVIPPVAPSAGAAAVPGSVVP